MLGLPFTSPAYANTRRVTGGPQNLLQDPVYVDITRNTINTARIYPVLNMQFWVFNSFTGSDWRSVIANWDQVKRDLDNGSLPSGFTYNFGGSDQVVQFAKQNSMIVKGGILLWGGDAPPSIVNERFSQIELERIAEFVVKSRVIRYRGQVEDWCVSSEMVTRALFNPLARFWHDNAGGYEIVYKAYQWTREMDPDAKLIISEDWVLNENFPQQPRQRHAFMDFLREIKARNIPVDGVSIQNNLWIYDPPRKECMISVLEEIKSLGYYIAPPEVNVSIADEYHWKARPKILTTVVDRDAAKAQIYRDVAEVYMSMNVGFGLGDWGDAHAWLKDLGRADAQAMLFNESNEPTRAYYEVVRVLLNALPIQV